MKTHFCCPGCLQKLQSTWFLSNCTVDPISCESCSRRLKLGKLSVVLAMIAMVPAMFPPWAVSVALGKWNQVVSLTFFFSMMALWAAIFLPLSWLLIVNFCSWEIVGDNSSVSSPSEANPPTRRRLLREGITWGIQCAVLWSLVVATIQNVSFLTHFRVAIIIFPIGGMIWAALRIYTLKASNK